MSLIKPAARYPVDPRVAFILTLSVAAGITALFVATAPESVDSLLPRWAVLAWKISLAAGSLVALVGIGRQSVNGIILEQVGSVMVGVAAIFYSSVALAVHGFSLLQTTVGIVLAWGLACLVRWAQLQALIHDGVKRQQNKAFVAEFYAELDARAKRDAANPPPVPEVERIVEQIAGERGPRGFRGRRGRRGRRGPGR